jgi:DNA primase
LDDSLPKYLNTPETPVFHKGESLYGLHASHKAIREKGRAVIVEGYMDFLALSKHGIKEVVASLGTALTENHVRKVKGYAKEAVVVFDSDEAGKTAALKTLPVFSNEGLTARAVVLPDGHDPDSFVQANGLEMFLELLDRASPMFDFFLEQRITERESDEGKVLVLKETLPILSEIRNFAMRSLYVGRLSERIGIKEDVVLSELKAFMKRPEGEKLESGMKERMAVSKAQKRVGDLQLLNLLVHYPQTVARLVECDCRTLLSDPAVVEIVENIFEKYHHEGLCSAEKLSESLKSEAAQEQLREILHRPFIVYSEQDVEQAVVEFEAKARQKNFLTSLKKAKGDAEAQNHLIKLQAERPQRS